MTRPQTPPPSVQAASDQARSNKPLADQARACAKDPIPRIAPSPWITRFAPLVAPNGLVLDVACGSGRHGLLFAQRGHPVVFVDRDAASLQQILAEDPVESPTDVITCDLEDGKAWPLGRDRFAAVIVCNYLFRPHLPDLFAAVAPGGVLLYETFAVGNERHGRPRNPDHLLKQSELLSWVPPSMQVVAFEQGEELRCSTPRVVQRLCAIKSELPAPLAP